MVHSKIARKLALIGANSVGKGFCMKALQQSLLQMPQVIMGEHFRHRRTIDHEFEKQYGPVMDAGGLLPNKVVIPDGICLLDAHQKKAEAMAVDGLFRDVEQVIEIAKAGLIGENDVACILKASRATARARNDHRLRSQPGGVHRKDDQQFDKRFNIYLSNIDSVIYAFRECGVQIVEIDANVDLKQVAMQVDVIARHLMHTPRILVNASIPQPYMELELQLGLKTKQVS
jgi:adenylate kinase family enzyme